MSRKCLNPYYTGSYSISESLSVNKAGHGDSLNPYYTGSYSIRRAKSE